MVEVLIALVFLVVASLLGQVMILSDEELIAREELDRLGLATVEFSKAVEQATADWEGLRRVGQKIRDEHPEWFDSDTGYLKERVEL